MILYWVATLTALTGLALSHAGRWHPAGDALAVFRSGLIGIAGALTGLGAAVGISPAVLLIGPVLSLATVLWPLLRPQLAGAGTFTLYQKNLSFQLADPAELLADIRACDPDVITLQEVSADNTAILHALADRWPHQQLCPHAPVGGVAVLSRHAPVGASDRLCATSLAALRVSGPAGPLWVVSLHLPWPWPFQQPLYRVPVMQTLRGLTGPVLLAGDFNMVPWSFTAAEIARSARGQRAGRARGTFPIGPVTLPIDQCIAPGPARTELRPLCGSDHHGLFVRL